MSNVVRGYKDILTDSEIVSISKIVRDFEHGIITYKDVEHLFEEKNISMVPKIIDASKLKTAKQVSELRDRVSKNELVSSDMDGYIISNDRYQDVIFRYDRYAIEKLAMFGDEKAIETLEALKSWEADFSNWQQRQKEQFDLYDLDFQSKRYK